jgi:hypothetical protein
MPEIDTPQTDRKTLAQRIAEGRMPASEALRCAMQVGDALRKLHDSGRAHGAVTPSHIVLSDAGAELLPAQEDSAGAVTCYTAPELLLGRPADPRSDIFSFGAVLYEMLTGRPAFEGEGRATLAANINAAPTPSSGSPAADRLIGPCLAKNPDSRTPRMQKILLELKLLSVAARRAEAAAAPSRIETVSGAVRAEMHSLESRLTARLTAHEQRVGEMQQAALQALKANTEALRAETLEIETRVAMRVAANEAAMAEIQRSATDAVGTLKEQLMSIGADVAVLQETLQSRPSEAEISERIMARVDRGLETAGEHVGRVEKSLEDLRNHTAHFERSVAADLVDIEQNMKLNAAAIESARTAMSQTDDLVERVVEALESLQTAVLDQTEAQPDRAAFAVN